MGTVWDVHRSGKLVESVGDELEFVERVDPENWKDYLIDLGASSERLDLDPVDYASAFVPKSFDDLARLVGGKKTGSGARSEGADY